MCVLKVLPMCVPAAVRGNGIDATTERNRFPVFEQSTEGGVSRTKSVWGKKHEQTLFFVVYLLRWDLVCADKFPLGVTSVVLDSSGDVAVIES